MHINEIYSVLSLKYEKFQGVKNREIIVTQYIVNKGNGFTSDDCDDDTSDGYDSSDSDSSDSHCYYFRDRSLHPSYHDSKISAEMAKCTAVNKWCKANPNEISKMPVRLYNLFKQ